MKGRLHNNFCMKRNAETNKHSFMIDLADLQYFGLNQASSVDIQPIVRLFIYFYFDLNRLQLQTD